MVMTGKTIIFLGDSLVAFYDWQGRFPDNHVMNLGRAGETVEGLLARTGGIIVRCPRPDVVIIMTGINNLAMHDGGLIEPYRGIIQAWTAAYGTARIMLQSILPTLDWISGEVIERVNGSLEGLAREEGVEFLDVHRLFVNGRGMTVPRYFLADGIHLSDQGYERWADALEAVFRQGGR